MIDIKVSKKIIKIEKSYIKGKFNKNIQDFEIDQIDLNDFDKCCVRCNEIIIVSLID